MDVEVAGARILDGKRTAAEVRAEVAAKVAALRARGLVPGLAVVLVGDDAASAVYVRNKDRAATEAGLAVRTITRPASVRREELCALLDALGSDPSVHGILVQLPLPAGLPADEVVRRIPPRKDVDGLHPENVARLWRGEAVLVPCTPAGCIELLDRHGIQIEGAHALVIGRSLLVGKPLAALLLARNATVTVAHSRSRGLAELCRSAEILVAAVGRPELVRGSWIRPGAAVLDVGINRVQDGRLVGDVAFAEAVRVAGALTPVPGGVGPMTVAMLLRNTVLAAAADLGLSWEEA